MKRYITYIEDNEKVAKWIDSVLTNYLKKNNEIEDQIQHILDYLVSDDSPKRIIRMSYDEALGNSKKWMKTQVKKGSKINELESDVEEVLVLENGFRWVQLIGENAYKREGFLMSHCVAYYFKKETKVYSLRDKNNMPHCTIEENQQIKGKGNGSIHPKYINYVVKFLEFLGMDVSDNEMKNLGYMNISCVYVNLSEELKNNSYNDTYLPIGIKLENNKGEEIYDFELWNQVFDEDMNVMVSDKQLELAAKAIEDTINGYSGKSVANGHHGKSVANGDHGKSVANIESFSNSANKIVTESKAAVEANRQKVLEDLGMLKIAEIKSNDTMNIQLNDVKLNKNA